MSLATSLIVAGRKNDERNLVTKAPAPESYRAKADAKLLWEEDRGGERVPLPVGNSSQSEESIAAA